MHFCQVAFGELVLVSVILVVMENLPYSSYESGSESSDDDKEKKKEEKKDKKQEAKKLGALTSFSFEKTEEKAEKKGFDSGFEKKETEKPKDEENKKSGEKAPDDESSDNKEDSPVKEASLEALKEQLDENIPKLESEVALSEPGTVEHEEAVAALETEKKLREIADDPSVEADEATTEEFDKRIAEIEGEELSDDVEIEGEAQPDSSDFEQTADEDTEVDDTDDVNNPWQHSTIPPVAPPPLPPSGGSATPGANNTPPSGPVASPSTPPPPSNPLPPFPRSFNSPPPPPGPSPNVAPASPNVLQNPLPERSERSKKAGAFLTGGIVGYAIGRRGGRKRTEAKLQPEIEKLQQESEQTKKHLERKETELSRAVQSRHESEAQSILQLQEIREAVKNEKSASEQKTEQSERDVPITDEKSAEIEQQKEESRPSVLERAAEATVLPLERAETKVVDIFNRDHEKVEKTPEQNLPYAYEIKKTEQLSTPQLLEQADLLFISGVSVKELYNSNRIDRYGLIKIVQESMRGHDIADTFEKVELGHERQAERAREFRHDDQGLALSTDDTTKIAAKPIGHASMQDVRPPDAPMPPTPLNLPASADPTDTEPIEQGLKTPNVSVGLDHANNAPKLVSSFAILAIVITAVILLFVFML